MPYRVNVTARAEQDLDIIYRFIQAEQSYQAAIWFNGLHEALQSLSSLPIALLRSVKTQPCAISSMAISRMSIASSIQWMTGAKP